MKKDTITTYDINDSNTWTLKNLNGIAKEVKKAFKNRKETGAPLPDFVGTFLNFFKCEDIPYNKPLRGFLLGHIHAEKGVSITRTVSDEDFLGEVAMSLMESELRDWDEDRYPLVAYISCRLQSNACIGNRLLINYGFPMRANREEKVDQNGNIKYLFTASNNKSNGKKRCRVNAPVYSRDDYKTPIDEHTTTDVADQYEDLLYAELRAEAMRKLKIKPYEMELLEYIADKGVRSPIRVEHLRYINECIFSFAEIEKLPEDEVGLHKLSRMINRLRQRIAYRRRKLMEMGLPLVA
jgi:hypothetical protein